MVNTFRFSCLIGLVLLAIESRTQSMEYIRLQAEGLIQSKQYMRAVPVFRQLQALAPQDYGVMLNRAVCEYEANNLDTAFVLALNLIPLQKPETSFAGYLAGKIAQSRGDFANAVVYFKQFLGQAVPGSKLYQATIAEIKRCGSALYMQTDFQASLVEPAGEEVNTIWNEVNPVPSVNVDSRIYFSSNREPAGFPLNYSADYESQYDMYSSSLNNGEWSDITALNPVLNTRGHELLSGFNENGRIVFFRRGEKLARMNFLVDTLKGEGLPPATTAIDVPDLGAEDELFYFTDSVLILSSNRPGGLGGFDLYYSIRSGSRWSSPVNLGIRINTPFDEVSPSLADDGRTLFFSSNNLKSMGGFDVFTAHFDDNTETWSEPVNLGMPLNSGDDDRYFRMLKNKLGAVFASNRKSGTGGFDIYFAYFRQSPAPQGERSRPLFFADVPAFKAAQLLARNRDAGINGEGQKNLIKVPVIYYLNDEQLKLPAIQKKMDEVVQLLKQNPTAQLIVEVFSDRSAATVSDDLMYSVLRGETVRDYLVQAGVRPSRIAVKGYGPFFPVAKEEMDGNPNPSGKSLNRRIEFTLYHPDPADAGTLFMEKDLVMVDARMQADERSRFLEQEKSLNYKIMLFSSGNAANFKTDTLGQVFIDKNNLTGKYELMSGVFTTFALANQARKKWMASGYEDALVVPYHSNQRIPPQLLNKWSEKFSDLTQFIYRGE